MEIVWHGLSCFRFIERGLGSVVTDPYGAESGLPELKLRADIVTVSHDEPCYNNVKAIKGIRRLVTGPGEYEIGGDSVPNRIALMEELKKSKVEINLCLLPKEITDDGIISVDQDGNDREFKAESIVVCRGFTADKRLMNALKGKIKEVRAIGDCVESRLIYEAVHEGWVAANQI